MRSLPCQNDEVSIGGENIDLFIEQVELELVNEFQGAVFAAFDHLTNLTNPLVQPAVRLLPFVAPMGRVAFLRNLIHPLRADLHFHPFARRGHERCVQRLITVGLGDGDPVSQPIGIGRVEIRHHAVSPPRIAFLLLRPGIQDYADGENVINVLERHLLLLHLIPDARDGFGSPFDRKLQPLLSQGLFDGRRE